MGKEMNDTERLNWISSGGRLIHTHLHDLIKSWHTERRAVSYYVNGYYRIVNGETLREAIDNAMKAYNEEVGN